MNVFQEIQALMAAVPNAETRLISVLAANGKRINVLIKANVQRAIKNLNLAVIAAPEIKLAPAAALGLRSGNLVWIQDFAGQEKRGTAALMGQKFARVLAAGQAIAWKIAFVLAGLTTAATKMNALALA